MSKSIGTKAAKRTSSKKVAAKKAVPPARKPSERPPLTPELTALADRFRRLALTLPGAEEGSHFGAPDFRVGGRIFATLAYADRGLGNLPLDPELQAAFLADAPEWFIPIPGGWGRMGHTSVRLEAPEEVIAGALATSHRWVSAKALKPARKRAVS